MVLQSDNLGKIRCTILNSPASSTMAGSLYKNSTSEHSYLIYTTVQSVLASRILPTDDITLTK